MYTLQPLELPWLTSKDRKFVGIVNNILTSEECNMLLSMVEGKYEVAGTNTGGGNMTIEENFRTSYTHKLHDKSFADMVYGRLRGANILPTSYHNHELSRISPYLNCLRYQDGGFFLPHRDGHYALIPEAVNSNSSVTNALNECGYVEISLLTMQIYLNTTSLENGGFTTFINPANQNEVINVQPTLGSILIFDQDLLHEGSTFTCTASAMYKDTCRLDVMYSPRLTPDSELPRVSISGVLSSV